MYYNDETGIVITECPKHWAHEAHTKRWGFLWLKKDKCNGLTWDEAYILKWGRVPREEDRWYAANPALAERLNWPHKHFYRIDRSQSTLTTMMFVCESCGTERPTLRKGCIPFTSTISDWFEEDNAVQYLRQKYIEGTISANQFRASIGLPHSMTADK